VKVADSGGSKGKAGNLAPLGSSLVRILALIVVSVVALQLYFALRVAAMAFIDPHSTTFQRSEIFRIATTRLELPWRQQWAPYDAIADSLKRAVIASEDAGFVEHSGVEWDAVEKAWERNQQAEAAALKLDEQARRRAGPAAPSAKGREPAAAGAASRAAKPARAPKIVGGSTITQQLAKNLFLGGERSLARKGQEFVITALLEALLPKERILEIYLNSVEWGEGVFGAEAAARHYFHVPAASLAPWQAARLAVMLPAPKRFEKRPASPYLLARSATVLARMNAVETP
jgi:monofunctional biosynthetic peptidoglycan transglycosylase